MLRCSWLANTLRALLTVLGTILEEILEFVCIYKDYIEPHRSILCLFKRGFVDGTYCLDTNNISFHTRHGQHDTLHRMKHQVDHGLKIIFRP